MTVILARNLKEASRHADVSTRMCHILDDRPPLTCTIIRTLSVCTIHCACRLTACKNKSHTSLTHQVNVVGRSLMVEWEHKCSKTKMFFKILARYKTEQLVITSINSGQLEM